jgi:hypothetical protein
MPKDDILSPEAETQLCGSDIFMALNVWMPFQMIVYSISIK